MIYSITRTKTQEEAMQDYASKQALIDEIQSGADAFIKEFDGLSDADKDIRFEGLDRTPGEMIAYQLGWMGLLQAWDRDELAGKPAALPAPGLKWNQMGELYQQFYARYAPYSLKQLRELFVKEVAGFIRWFKGFSDDEVFKSGGRKWASSTASAWPIWKWVHINTVAPFKTFRSKIRKWKKLKENLG
jgi:hypothetical protein